MVTQRFNCGYLRILLALLLFAGMITSAMGELAKKKTRTCCKPDGTLYSVDTTDNSDPKCKSKNDLAGPVTTVGVPSLQAVPASGSIIADDVPMSFRSGKGPMFSFAMSYSTKDFRTNSVPRPLGPGWSHAYQCYITVTGTVYQLGDLNGVGSQFTLSGTNFTEQGTIGSFADVDLSIQMAGTITNIIAITKTWAIDSHACNQGCSSCGGTSVDTPSMAVLPPHTAWHVGEGYVFEPDVVAGRYHLKQIIAADGNAMNVYYDTYGNITSMVDAAGNTFNFAYSGGLLTNIHDVTGNRDASFVYNGGFLAQVTDMGGQTFKYGYDATTGWLTALDRPNNLGGFDETSIAYDGAYTNGPMTITLAYPAGNSGYLYWDDVSHDTMQDNLNGLGVTLHKFETPSWGPMETTQIDPFFGLTTKIVPFDNCAAILMGKLQTRISGDGTFKNYEYDSNGNLAMESDYDSLSNLIVQTTCNRTYFPGTYRVSSLTNTAMDANQNLLSMTSKTYSNPAAGIYVLVSEKTWISASTYSEKKYIYDTNTWLLVEEQDLVSGTNNYRTVNTYSYDSNNRVACVTDALTNRTYIGYDSIGCVSVITNQVGGISRETDYYYDNLDRMTNIVYPDGFTEQWNWAPCGCGDATHTDRGGNVTTKTYDPNKRLQTKTTTSPNGTILSYARYEYNGADKITKTYDILSNYVENVYNSSGFITDTIDELGRITSYSYDTLARKSLTTYPDGSISSNTYDSASRVIKVSRYASSTSSTPLTFTQYAYDGLGRVVTTTDALGNVTSNSYDLAGHTIQVTYPDGSFSATEYDLLGNVIEKIGPVPAGATQQQISSATTSNSYDVLNRLVSTTDPVGRITTYEYSSAWPQKVATTIDANNQVVQQNFYDPLSGFMTSNVSYNVVMQYTHDALGQVINTIYPDSTFTTNSYDGTRLVAQTTRTGNTTSFGFDLDGRTTSMTNSLGAVTLYFLDAVGNRTNMTDALTNSTLYTLDSMNRITVTTRPDGSASTNTWDQLGRLIAKTGAGAVPVTYGYDADSRMTSLVDGMTNTTTFQYDQLSRLIKKTYADGSFYQYGYNARGWLTSRLDAKGVATAYAYNNDGQLTNVNYATDTDVQYFLDTLGRATNRIDSAGTWSWTYDSESSRVLSETLSGQSVVSYSYAPNTFDLASVGSGSYTTLYSWAAGRLTNVTAVSANSARAFSYSYKPNSDLLRQTAYLGGTVTVYRAYDVLNRLTSISATNNNSATVNSFAYQLDSLGRRVQRTDADNSQTQWKYDNYDQLTNGVRSGSANGAADAAYNFGYTYDQVGNRLQENRGQLSLNGSFNNLNQLTHLAWNGNAGIVGSVAATNAVVLVQGYTNAPPFYNQTNWLGEAMVHEGSNNIAIVAWQGTNYSGTNVTVFMPPLNPESFSWDANGNMLSDGQRTFTWDNENRLIVIETKPNLGLPQLRSEYLYDAQSRRIQKKDMSNWNGTAYATTNVTKYVWNGWLLLAELNSDNSVKAYNVHGLDLSQSLQGAGGIGGLLCEVLNGTNLLYTFDGNGNVTDVLGTQGTSVAHYEYDPFGRTVAQSGSYADQNLWRFSTKQIEPAWDLYYYGYRFYSPNLHTWLNRDPFAEEPISDWINDPMGRRLLGISDSLVLDGTNSARKYAALYTFVGNTPVSANDPLGLETARPDGNDLLGGAVGWGRSIIHNGLGKVDIPSPNFLFNYFTYTFKCGNCYVVESKPAVPIPLPAGSPSGTTPPTSWIDFNAGTCSTDGKGKLSVETSLLYGGGHFDTTSLEVAYKCKKCL